MNLEEKAIYRIKIKDAKRTFSDIFENADERFKGETKNGEAFPKYSHEDNTLLGIGSHDLRTFEFHIRNNYSVTIPVDDVEYYQIIESYPQNNQ